MVWMTSFQYLSMAGAMCDGAKLTLGLTAPTISTRLILERSGSGIRGIICPPKLCPMIVRL